MRLLICIAFHYVPERYKYLKTVLLRFIETYKINIHIHIDTNSEESITLVRNDFNTYLDSGGISIHTHTNLQHPFLLTWMHRLFMASNINNFELFMYLEDDIDIPFENFIRYIENIEILYPARYPAFFRIEKQDSEKYWVDGPANIIRYNEIIELNGRRFLSLKSSYHACWAMRQKDLGELINDNFINPRFIDPAILELHKNTGWNSWGIREIAASYPLYSLNKQCFVEILPREGSGVLVSPLSMVEHLPKNYTSGPHKLVRYEDMILLCVP